MMVVSLHDRISGHANRVRCLDRFLRYAKLKPGVWFARKDQIAAWVLTNREHTPVRVVSRRRSAVFPAAAQDVLTVGAPTPGSPSRRGCAVQTATKADKTLPTAARRLQFFQPRRAMSPQETDRTRFCPDGWPPAIAR